MAHLERANGETTEYAYREVEVKSGVMLGIKWDVDASLDKSISRAAGADNECQLLAIDDAGKSPMHLALQDNVIGQDSLGNDIHEYSVIADDAAYDAEKMDEIRSERDTRLKACDFSQLSDSPFDGATKTAWATYRQELRDLPAGITDVDNVTWPTEP